MTIETSKNNSNIGLKKNKNFSLHLGLLWLSIFGDVVGMRAAKKIGLISREASIGAMQISIARVTYAMQKITASTAAATGETALSLAV